MIAYLCITENFPDERRLFFLIELTLPMKTMFIFLCTVPNNTVC